MKAEGRGRSAVSGFDIASDEKGRTRASEASCVVLLSVCFHESSKKQREVAN